MLCIVYAMAYAITMQQNMLCIGNSSIGDGDQDDCVLFRYDSEMKPTTPHEHQVYMYIFTLSFIASIMSFIIVWLIDLQTHVNGFILMVTKVAKTQIVMDFGFFLVTMAFSLHRRHVMGDRIHMDKQVYPLYVIGTLFVTFGDCATQLWSLVICLVFVRIARDGLALDVKKELSKVANIVFGVSSVFALLEVIVCWDKCWILSGCIINYIRAIFSVLVIVLCGICTIYVRWRISFLDPGPRKTAINTLSTRMFFYPIYGSISRVGYIVLGLRKEAWPMLFSSRDSSLTVGASYATWIMWWPQGIGNAIFYLATHNLEFKYFLGVLMCKKGHHFVPDDVRDTLISSPLFKVCCRTNCAVAACSGAACDGCGRCCYVPEEDKEGNAEAATAARGSGVINPIGAGAGAGMVDGCGSVQGGSRPLFASSLVSRDSALTVQSRASLRCAGKDTFSEDLYRHSAANSHGNDGNDEYEHAVRVSERWFGDDSAQTEELLCAEVLVPRGGAGSSSERVRELSVTQQL